MSKYCYYTPISLAEEILKLIPRQDYRTIIDICCGTWNLLAAARKYYPESKYYGVDVDGRAQHNMFEGAQFFLNDGRKFSQDAVAAGKKFDLILSNPPFGRMNEDESYWRRQDENMPFSALISRRYESEMMLANILLAHDNSVLVFILPITFLIGESYEAARKQISEFFSILEIVELPVEAFAGNNLKTVAIVIKKRKKECLQTNYRIAKYKDGTWLFDSFKTIEIDGGNWEGKKLKGSAVLIKRGKIHSGELTGGNKKVMHCSSKFDGKCWKPSIRSTDCECGIYAERGDIIINRVGRGAGYWCVNKSDRVGVSDCLFVIKNPTEDVERRLLRNTKDGKLCVPVRGVSTRYITQKDICSLLE
ncbi:type I restriction enzyme M protein [Lachnospiraceae bacterium XBD2001]|nr:type I restriction enzyme M protein [Lachnospiraceae bacterium XBD2001]